MGFLFWGVELGVTLGSRGWEGCTRILKILLIGCRRYLNERGKDHPYYTARILNYVIRQLVSLSH